MEIWTLLIPILRILLFLSAVGVIGTFLFSLHFQHHQSAAGQAYCWWVSKISARLGWITAAGMFFAHAGNMGGDFASIIDRAVLSFTLHTKAGSASLLAFLGFVTFVIGGYFPERIRRLMAIFACGMLLTSFVMVGHATKGGAVIQIILLVHLLGVAFWLGALLPFRWMCHNESDEEITVIAPLFGRIAIFYVGALVSAGLVMAVVHLGAASALISTRYGNILLVKLVMVSSLLALAAWNKFRLVPLLVQNPAIGRKKFQRIVGYEIGVAMMILLLSGLLTTLPISAR